MKSERGMTDDNSASRSYDHFISAGSKVYFLEDSSFFVGLTQRIASTHNIIYNVDNIYITIDSYDFTDIAVVDESLFAYLTNDISHE